MLGCRGQIVFDLMWQVITRWDKNNTLLTVFVLPLFTFFGQFFHGKKTCWYLWELVEIISFCCVKIHITTIWEMCNVGIMGAHCLFHCVYGNSIWKPSLCTARASTSHDIWRIKCTLPWFLLRSRNQMQYIPQTITRRKEPDCYGYRKIFLPLRSTHIKCCIEPKKNRNGSDGYL